MIKRISIKLSDEEKAINQESMRERLRQIEEKHRKISRDRKDSEERELSEYIRLNGPIHDHPKPGAHLKKIIVEKGPEWYFKVIGMLQHNYAFINEESPGKVMVYFCHERGSTLGRFPGHIVLNPLDGDGRLPCIVDSFEFSSALKAQSALARNHFSLISELADDSSFDVAPPSGNKFYDMREYESGIYSKQDKWWIKSYFD